MGGVCAYIVHSPLHEEAYLRELEQRVASALPAAYYRGRMSGNPLSLPKDCRGFLFVVGTGGTEHLVLEAVRLAGGRPSVVLAHDAANSLPALAEAQPLLKSVGGVSTLACRYEVLEGCLSRAYRALEAALSLLGVRIGVIGGVSDWLVYSRTPAEVLERRLGARVTLIPWERVAEKLSGVGRVDSGELLKEAVLEVPESEVARALALYVALKELMEEEGLDAVTLRCFDVIGPFGTTLCLAASLLNSGRSRAGCEGDLPALLSMLVLSSASGSPAFMGNIASIEGRRVMIAHCTAPVTMGVGRPVLRTHFESGVGVGVAVTFPTGPVTLLRLSPDLSRARVFEGTVVEGRPVSPRHCRSQAWVEVGFDPTVLLTRSMGNHYALVPGRWAIEVSLALESMGFDVEVL